MADIGIKVALQGIAGIQQQLNGLTGSFSKVSDSISNSASSMKPQLDSATASLNALTGAGMVWAATKISGPLKAFGRAAIGMAGQMQQAEMGFTTLFRSAEKAMEFLEELRDFAATTPFEFVGLQTTARRMVALGFETKQVIPVLRVLGDTVGAMGGTQEQLDRIIYNMGQMKMIGKVTGHEMRDLAMAGVKAWDYLANAIGKSVPEAMEQARKGTIDAKTALVAVFMGMQRDFGGGMEKQMGLLQQGFSNLKDEMNFVMAEIGKTLNETLNIQIIVGKVTTALHNLRVGWESIPGPIRSVLAVVGLLAAALPPLLLALSGIGAIAPVLIAGLGNLGITMTALGATFAAITGPVGIVVMALVAIGTAIYVLVKRWDDLSYHTKVAMMKMKIAVFEATADMLESISSLTDIWDLVFHAWIQSINWGIQAGNRIRESFLKGWIDGISELSQLGMEMGEAIRKSASMQGAGPIDIAAKKFRQAAQEELGKMTVLQGPRMLAQELANLQQNFNALVQLMAKKGMDVPKILNEFKKAGGDLSDLSATMEHLKTLAGDNFMELFGMDAKKAGTVTKEVTNIMNDLNAKLKENQIMFNLSTTATSESGRVFEKLKADIEAHKAALSSLLKESPGSPQVAEITYKIKVLGDQLFVATIHEVGIEVSKLQSILQSAGVPIEDLTSQFKEGEDPVKQLKEHLEDLGKKYEAITEPVVILEKELRNNAIAVKLSGDTLNENAMNAESVKQTIMKLTPELGENSEVVRILTSTYEFFKQAGINAADGLVDIDTEMRALSATMKKNEVSSSLLGKGFDLNKAQADAFKESIIRLEIALGKDSPIVQALKTSFTGYIEQSEEASMSTKLYEQAVRGVATAVKGIWDGTKTTFEDVWKGALSTFVDVMAQMVIQAQITGAAISVAMAAATFGISLIIGMLAMALGGSESIIKIVPITTRLKEVFDDFVDDFKSAVGDFKEYLFPAKGEAAAAKSVIYQEPSVIKALNTFKSSVEWGKNLKGDMAAITRTRRMGGWSSDVMDFPQVTNAIKNLNQSLKDAGSTLQVTTEKWKNWLGTDSDRGVALSTINDLIVSAAQKLSDNVVEFGNLMEERFNKIKDIVGDILGLYEEQQDFAKDMNQTITDVQRSLLAPQDLLTAQMGDIESLKTAVAGAVGEEQISLLAELKDAYTTVWGTVQDMFGEGTPENIQAVTNTIESLTGDLTKAIQGGESAEGIWEIQKQLIDANEELAGLQIANDQLTEWQAVIVEGLEGVADVGKTAYDELIDINLDILGVQRDGNTIASQMETYLKNLGGAKTAEMPEGGLITQTLTALLDIGETLAPTQAQLDLILLAFDQLFDVPKLAHGGIVSKPTLALIGEAGPEAVVPLDKMSGSNINVRIDGAMIMDEITMSKFTRQLETMLRRQQTRYA